MVQSPSWEANWFAASQEIPRISRNPMVHYRTHNSPSPLSILGRPNPVHIRTSYLLEIRPSIIHSSSPRSTQWFLPSGFPSKILYNPLSSPIRATKCTNVLKFSFGIKLYMFRTVPLSINRVFLLYTQQWYTSHNFVDNLRTVPSWSCSQAVSKSVWYTTLLCLQWKSFDDGQRNCPKHVDFFFQS